MVQTRKQRERSTAGALDMAFVLAVLAGIYVWVKSGEWMAGIAAFAAGVVAVAAALQLAKTRRMGRLRQAGMDTIDQMTGEQFEELLLAHFRGRGYSGRLTPNGSDFGADLVIEQGGQKTVVQAKRWARTVGVKAVQEIAAAKAHYGAERAMVVTNSTFTAEAIKLARSNRVDLWDRERLAGELNSPLTPAATKDCVSPASRSGG